MSVTLRTIPLSQLVALRRNPQYLTESQQKALEESIRRDGFLCPIIVRPGAKDNRYEILSGNHRVLASRSVGLDEIPCCLIDPCSDEQAARIAVNMNSVHGDPNVELLAPFLAQMSDEVLASVYIEPPMMSELLEFDKTLKERLDLLQAPEALDKPSLKGTTPNCVCKCGHRHVRARKNSKSSTAPTIAASKRS